MRALVELFRCVVLGCAGGGVALNGARASEAAHFALGAVVGGSIALATTRPIFGDESELFALAGDGLCVVAALVAGCVATLLPRFSLAAALGAVLGLPLVLAAAEMGLDPGIAPDTAGSTLQASVAFAVFLVLSTLGWHAVSHKAAEPLARAVAFSCVGAWLAVLGLDGLGSGALWAHVVSAVRPHDVSAPFAFGASDQPLVWEAALWFALSFGAVAAHAWFGALKCGGRPRGYDTVRSAANGFHGAVASVSEMSPGASQHTQIVSDRAAAFNVFDPEALPRRLKRFSGPIFSAAEAVGNFFGFQDDSVRNQAEHALMLLANIKAQQDSSPLADTEAEMNRALRSLHTKLFANYRLWCKSLEVRPVFAPPPEALRDVGGSVVDIVLWLSVWGEAANLRHLPECVCFLYHAAAGEWAATPRELRFGERGACLYQGHWLDSVVLPIYDVVEQSMKAQCDHVDKRNYDDFNEFFWTKECFKCHYSSRMTPTASKHLEVKKRGKTTGFGEIHSAYGASDAPPTSVEAPEPGQKFATIAEKLKLAPKTYLEKRTWLHVVYAFRRIYEFHVVSFQVLAIVAFSDYLVWDEAFLLQALSIVAITLNVLAIAWAALECYVTPEAVAESVTAAALAARLVTRFVILTYQTVYVCWSLDSFEQMPDSDVRSLRVSGDAHKMKAGDLRVFWWWQHVWLSGIVFAFYAVEMLLQLWPRGLTLLREFSGDLAVSMMAVFVPASTLYVGKSVHEPYCYACKYHFYWATLIALKLWFGFNFLVKPMVEPSIEMVDDYANYPKQPNRTIIVLAQLAGRWTPPALIYMMDSAIWYSLWAAVVGTIVGFDLKLGIVRDFPAIRDAFLLLPKAFCTKLVAEAPLDKGRAHKTDQVTNPPGQRPRDQDDATLAAAARLAESRACVPCCASDDGFENAGRKPFAMYKSPQSSSTDLASSLGAASASGGIAARLPSFLSLADLPQEPAAYYAGAQAVAAAATTHARQGLLELLENGSRGGKRISGASLSTNSSGGSLVQPWTPRDGLAAPVAGGDRNSASVFGKSRSTDEAQWVLFAEAWNAVILEMRKCDILSDKEVDYLSFDRFVGYSKPIYLPIFVTAGAVERAVAAASEAAMQYRPLADQAKAVKSEDAKHLRFLDAASKRVEDHLAKTMAGDVVASEALDEVRELGTRLLVKLLGPVHRDDVVAIVSILDRWNRESRALEMVKLEEVHGKVLQPLAALAGFLAGKALAKRQVAAKQDDANLQANLEFFQMPSEEAKTMDDDAQDRPAAAPPVEKAGAGAGAGGMKRTQSTSGLVFMASQPAAVQFTAGVAAPPRPGATKKYSLASDKYVVTHKGTEAPDAFRDAVRDKVRAVLGGLKAVINVSRNAQAREVYDRITFVLANERGFFWDDVYAGCRLDLLRAELAGVQKPCKKLREIITVQQRETEPRGNEANRRLTFFVNSMLMELPMPPPVEAMASLTTLTPFYSEDVILDKADLVTKNLDGVTTLLYLQTLYKADWENYVQRRQIRADGDVAELFSAEHRLETRLWASFRAQTLARTVQGMMHCESALRLLAKLEHARNTAAGVACEALSSIEDTLKLKFGYIISCQVYGKMRKDDDPKATEIELLLRRFPGLRVAFIDEVRLNRQGAMAFYSVLVKAGDAGKMEEVFRVRLPGNPVIGEGKPENQNHAMVFTRGECLQTIDMNQDGFFEEALKMRNLLAEFGNKATDPAGTPPVTIVGFREHIFTGSVSSLANYMALQELCFVTLGQRVLSNPLRMRLHYGHPDIFDKLWFVTRGGVSKASKGINLSEDIFAGYNAVIRGGSVTMKEYAQVGKGRDVGMQQIFKFEAKLAQGNAEQCLSRDVQRFADRLDFPRLLTYYFGGVGHYINSALTVLTIQISTYLSLMLAVYGAEAIGERLVVPLGPIQIALAGLGLANTLPLLATLTVERGLAVACRDVLQVFVSGGPLYFVFHIQTRAHYFFQTLIAGGATYRATGRGFVTRHSSFDEQYRFFASSHLYLGVELSAALVLIGVHSASEQYASRTWSLWLATGAFLLAPFWFNPLGFSFPHVLDDGRKWLSWISSKGGTIENSWEVWWREETAVYRRLQVSSKLLISTKAAVYVVLARGLADRDLAHATQVKHFVVVIAALAALAAVQVLADRAAYSLSYATHRLVKMCFGVATVGVLIAAALTHRSFSRLVIALYYLAAAVNTIGTLVGIDAVRHLQRLHDILIGLCFFAIFLPLSALHVFDVIQTKLLFHNALSQGVVVDDILKQARRSQENSAPDADTELRDLRRAVDDQQRQIAQLLNGAPRAASDEATEAVDVEAAPAAPRGPPQSEFKAAAGPKAMAAAKKASPTVEPARAPTPPSAPLPHRELNVMAASRSMNNLAQPSAFNFKAPDDMPPRA